MKKYLFSFLTIFLLTFCSHGRGKLDELKVPDWVLDPYSKTINANKAKEIAGVGMAEDAGDLSVQIQEAEQNARLSVAQQIKVTVKNKIENTINKSEAFARNNPATDKKMQDLIKKFEQKTEETVDQELANCSRTDMYQDQNKVMYIRVAMSRADVINKISENLKKDFKDPFSKKMVNQINEELNSENFSESNQ